MQSGKIEAAGWRFRKDRTQFLASVVIDPVYEDGDLVGFAEITRDIAERRADRLEKIRQLAES